MGFQFPGFIVGHLYAKFSDPNAEAMSVALVFSERELRYVRYMLSPFRLSVVCNVGAPYSAG